MPRTRFLAVPLFTLCANLAHAQDCGLYEAIEPGDTLSAIAARCNTSVEALYSANPGINARDLEIGSVLSLGPASPSSDARSHYEANMLGHYSPSTACMTQELVLGLAPDRVTLGETSCAIRSMELQTGDLHLSLTNCMGEGEPTEDFDISITLASHRDLTLVNGDNLYHLARCKDID